MSDLSSAPIPLPDEVERRGPNGRDDSCCPKSLRLATPTRWRSKRVKFAYFLARARIVSKGLMVRGESEREGGWEGGERGRERKG